MAVYDSSRHPAGLPGTIDQTTVSHVLDVTDSNMLPALARDWITFSYHRAGIALLLGLLGTLPSTRADDSVDQLIGSLDSPQFIVRESATRQLVQVGAPALKKLADHYFSASPEQAWRIKRVLEEIGTTHEDPETCFKSIGILFVLDSNIGDRIVELLDDWKENRSDKAIEFLKSKGAQFSNGPTGINLPLGRLDIDIRQVLERELKSQEQANSQPKPETGPLSQDDPEQVQEKVSQILNASLAENENFVWELYRQLQSKQAAGYSGAKPNALAGNPILMNQRNQIILQPFSFDTSQGLLAVFDETWQGSADDLERLDHIYQLNGLAFKNRSISLEEAVLVSGLDQLQYFAINGCHTDGYKLKDLGLPKSLQVLDLGQFQLDTATVQMLTDLNLLVLRMEECELSPGAIEAFSSLTTVQNLSWTRTPISGELFDAMAQLPALRTVSLSVSKFQHEDKKRFDQQRPNCRFINVPVAFLGVQGPQTLSSYQREENCLIEQVVADSSADKAGIEPGDIIRKVSGQPIEKFEDLRMFITQHNAGESLELDVERNGKIIKIPVELGSIDESLVR
ncbi:MAG: PDZ domain-containing protein [Mariniblastus sp.]|nr:PDZ domain-containing protein [Mariniblastus sp.]